VKITSIYKKGRSFELIPAVENKKAETTANEQKPSESSSNIQQQSSTTAAEGESK